MSTFVQGRYRGQLDQVLRDAAEEVQPQGGHHQYREQRGFLLPCQEPHPGLPHLHLQLLRPIGGGYSIDDLIEVAFQHSLQVMEG